MGFKQMLLNSKGFRVPSCIGLNKLYRLQADDDLILSILVTDMCWLSLPIWMLLVF